MKTVKIKNAVVEEIIFRPNDETPISVLYKLYDDAGELLTTKRVQVPKTAATSQLANFSTKILEHITSEEDL